MMLENKVAVVTGGTGRMGESTSLLFAREGAKVVVTSRKAESAEKIAKVIRSAGGSAMSFQLEPTDNLQVKQLVQTTLERYETVDILVNCFYESGGMIKSEDVTPEFFKRIEDININATWYCCQEVMKVMMRNMKGKIINVSASAGLNGVPKYAPYGVTKAAVVQMTRCLAADLGPYNVNVNCIAPGTFMTAEQEKSQRESRSALYQYVRKRYPIGRFGTPEEMANAALFFASSMSDYITGAVLPVDGGATTCLRAYNFGEEPQE